jgi:hypothetical protein
VHVTTVIRGSGGFVKFYGEQHTKFCAVKIGFPVTSAPEHKAHSKRKGVVATPELNVSLIDACLVRPLIKPPQ